MERVKCRRCGRVVQVKDLTEFKSFPFCSQRCRLIDLGQWLDERHRIPGEELSPDEDERGDGDGGTGRGTREKEYLT